MDVVTTVLELAGLLLLVVSLAVLLWMVHPAAAFAGAGVALLGCSWLIVRPRRGGGR